MKARIDKAGRIVIPKALREDLGLIPNSKLEIIRDGWEIRIRKVEENSFKVLKKDGFLVIDYDGEFNFSEHT